MTHKTRDELQKELAIAIQSNINHAAQDSELRRQFSEVLDAPLKRKGQYDYIEERRTYSWNEIFCEVGKLLANQEFASNHTEMHKFAYDIKQLQEMVEHLTEHTDGPLQ